MGILKWIKGGMYGNTQLGQLVCRGCELPYGTCDHCWKRRFWGGA